MVTTDAFDQMNEDYNERFKIVSSESKDAPPKGEWMRLSKVNFVRWKMFSKGKGSDKKLRRASNPNYTYEHTWQIGRNF